MATRSQIGSAVSTAAATASSIASLQISSISAGSCVVYGVRALANSATTLVMSVTDTAGGAYTVIPAMEGTNFYSFLAVAHNHPGGSNVVITGAFSGTTVDTGETNGAAFVLSGTVGEISPIKAGSTIITTAANTALSHAKTLTASELSIGIQATYYATPLAPVSPAVEVYSVGGDVLLISTLSQTGSVTHAHTGASGRQVNLSIILSDPVGDTDPPLLTSPTGAATGATTASGSVSTNEATGTLYRVTTTNATETGATVKAGASQAVTASGTQTMGATGLTASTTYRHHYLHRDAAGNDSTVASSATFTTEALDTTGPALTIGTATVKSNALIEIGATTNEATGTMYAVLTTSATPPSSAQVRAGQNNAGTAASWAGNQAIASTGAKTFNATGPAANTGYYPYIVHRDASGNDSTVMSIGLRTTFRDGATGQWILDHPGSFMSQCIEAGDEDAWFDWETVTPPASGSWMDGPYADGTGVFSGPDATSMVILLRKNGVSVGNFTVTLYDSTTRVTATQAGAWSVRNLVSATQSGAWSVRNLVTATQSGAWSVEASGGTAPLTDAEMRDLYERVIALQAELQQVKAATGLIPALL